MGVCKSKNQTQQPELVIKTTTWQRDSHGLFDYEGKDQEKKQLKALGSFSLMRHEVNIEIKYDEEDENLEESKEEEVPQTQIAKVVEKNGAYWIFHSSTIDEEDEDNEKNPELKLWRIVKYCTQAAGSINGYKMLPEDLLKLGRVRFKVREIQSPAYKKMQMRHQVKSKKFFNVRTSGRTAPTKKNENEVTETDNYQIEHGVSEQVGISFPNNNSLATNVILPKGKEIIAPLVIRETSLTSGGIPLCRICLSEDNDLENPLFSPCKCKGTMKFIHLACLQEWLNSRKVTKETPITKTYFWKNLECELCKTQYPNHVRTGDNKSIYLRVIQYEVPQYQAGEEPTYIVFESITSNTSKVIHVVNMLNVNEIKLGRGHDAEVRVTDISVSRLHAVLKKTQKGYFILEDNKSKFGTLVMVRNPLPLSINETNYIQAGRTQVEISIKRPIKIFNNCICSPGANTNNDKQRRSSTIKGGLTTKNGIDFFPEEFLSDKRKQMKRSKNESQIRMEKNMHTAFQSEGVEDFQMNRNPDDIEIDYGENQNLQEQHIRRQSIYSQRNFNSQNQNILMEDGEEEVKFEARQNHSSINIPDMTSVIQQHVQQLSRKSLKNELSQQLPETSTNKTQRKSQKYKTMKNQQKEQVSRLSRGALSRQKSERSQSIGEKNPHYDSPIEIQDEELNSNYNNMNSVNTNKNQGQQNIGPNEQLDNSDYQQVIPKHQSNNKMNEYLDNVSNSSRLKKVSAKQFYGYDEDNQATNRNNNDNMQSQINQIFIEENKNNKQRQDKNRFKSAKLKPLSSANTSQMFKNHQNIHDRMRNSKDFQDYSDNHEIQLDQQKYKEIAAQSHAKKSHQIQLKQSSSSQIIVIKDDENKDESIKETQEYKGYDQMIFKKSFKNQPDLSRDDNNEEQESIDQQLEKMQKQRQKDEFKNQRSQKQFQGDYTNIEEDKQNDIFLQNQRTLDFNSNNQEQKQQINFHCYEGQDDQDSLEEELQLQYNQDVLIQNIDEVEEAELDNVKIRKDFQMSSKNDHSPKASCVTQNFESIQIQQSQEQFLRAHSKDIESQKQKQQQHPYSGKDKKQVQQQNFEQEQIRFEEIDDY